MPSTATLTVVGVIVLAILIFLFLRARQSDFVAEIMKKRAGSKLVSKADYVEGAETIPVVISLTDDTFYYENADLQASFELARIDEVEYADDVMTGKHIRHGCRVLRLRSHGATFEFVLDTPEAKKWESALRTHRMDDEPNAAAV
jgi:hypothetical protein